MDISAIIAEFGAYYIKQKENMRRLVKQLNFPSKTDTVLTPFFTDDTVYRASESRMGRILQPFQKQWTPISSLEFLPVAIELFKMKIDTQEYPDDLEGSWLGFLAGDSIDRKEWPFIRWFVEVHLLPKAKEDYEMNEVWAGAYAAPTAGTPGAAGTAMNGLRKAINDNITGGRITPIVLGAVPTDPALMVDYVEDLVDGIDKRYWSIAMQLCMSEANERLYRRGKRAKYGKDTDFDGVNTKVEETQITVIGLPSMTGSPKMWCTPKSNSLKLGKKTQNMDTVKIENVDRLVKLYSDWWSGVGFVIPEIVFTNDQDLPTP